MDVVSGASGLLFKRLLLQPLPLIMIGTGLALALVLVPDTAGTEPGEST